MLFGCKGAGPDGTPDGGRDKLPGRVGEPGGRGGIQFIPDDPAVQVGSCPPPGLELLRLPPGPVGEPPLLPGGEFPP